MSDLSASCQKRTPALWKIAREVILGDCEGENLALCEFGERFHGDSVRCDVLLVGGGLIGDEHPHGRCPHDRRRDPAKDDE